jgi:polysaccharide chain length determinant protein (PEP-CTERM system associated)
LDGRLDALRKGLDDLLRRYTERHPDVASTRRIIADLEKQREAQLEERRRALQQSGPKATVSSADRNPVYQQLKIALADAGAKAAAMGARVSELQKRRQQMEMVARIKPEIEEQLSQLNREYSVHKANYEGLVARRESAMLTGELDQSAGVADFRIIEPPRVPSRPVAPDRHLLLGLVIALSVGAGVMASFVASQVLPTFSTIKSLQQVAQRPVLGVVSFQNTPIQDRMRRKRRFAFAGAIGGLFAVYGCALIILASTAGA